MKATQDELEERGAGKSPAAQGAAAGSSFPELAIPGWEEALAKTPVPNVEEMGPKDRPKPTKAGPSNVASKPEKQGATASSSQAAAATGHGSMLAPEPVPRDRPMQFLLIWPSALLPIRWLRGHPVKDRPG